MRHKLIEGCVLICSVLRSCSAQQTVQDSWVVPGPPDFQDTFTLGHQIEIQWADTLWQWFASYAPTADIHDVDLWVTGYYIHQYAHLVSIFAASVDINGTFSLPWTSQLPAAEVSDTTQWVFRFLPHGLDATGASLSNDTVSSPGFNFKLPTSSSPSSSSVHTTAAATSTGSTPNSAATTASAPSATILGPSNRTSGLSAGDKAGIAVGAAAGAALLLGIGWYVVRRRRRSVMSKDAAAASRQRSLKRHAEALTGMLENLRHKTPETSLRLSELEGGSRTEVNQPVELYSERNELPTFSD